VLFIGNSFLVVFAPNHMGAFLEPSYRMVRGLLPKIFFPVSTSPS